MRRITVTVLVVLLLTACATPAPASPPATPTPQAARLTNVPPEVVSKAYDQLSAAGAWPVNDGMPNSDVEHTIATLRTLGNLQPGDSISPAQLIDRAPATAAVQALGGPMTGDPRWK
jgi:hypothetical protein